ncbi:MAG: hypothetical protein AAF998_10130 [Bacteroidota bacterium]
MDKKKPAMYLFTVPKNTSRPGIAQKKLSGPSSSPGKAIVGRHLNNYFSAATLALQPAVLPPSPNHFGLLPLIQ